MQTWSCKYSLTTYINSTWWWQLTSYKNLLQILLVYSSAFSDTAVITVINQRRIAEQLYFVNIE